MGNSKVSCKSQERTWARVAENKDNNVRDRSNFFIIDKTNSGHTDACTEFVIAF